MKTAELTALGITEEIATQILAINGKDIENAKAAKDKEIAALTTERDGLKTRLDTADAALKKFEGIDPEQIQKEIQTYKQQAEDAEKKYSAQIARRDQKEWITAQLDKYGVKSPLARKQITAEVMSEKDGLKWKPGEDDKSGMFYGFDDYMKAAKEEDSTLYQTAEEKAAAEEAAKKAEEAAAAAQKAPKFTGAAGEPAPTGEKFTPPKIF